MNKTTTDNTCYHCGLPVPNNLTLSVVINDEPRPMCCYGCQAVAQSIVDSGMSDFYRYRTDLPATPEEIVPAFLSQLHAYDNPIIQKQFIQKKLGEEDGDIREVSLILEGIVCAACVWLNEKTLQALDGVINVSVNYATHRARLKWNNDILPLSSILEAISRIGYMAHPYDPERHQLIIEKERKMHLKRIGVAAIFGMQIMILAVAMYSGEWWGMDPGFMQTFRWTSLALCIPLLLFSSSLFINNAWRDIKNHRVGMDVPVALGMLIAFIASVYHTFIDQGAVYYDSVSMFTFFLLVSRYFEIVTRKRSTEHTESLLNLTPAVATKISGDDEQQIIPVAELLVGDHILVRAGENIAADGIVIRGTSGVNESLVTGESTPVTKDPGDEVIGGSSNTENALVVKISHTGDETVLASIHRLLDEAQKNKPQIALLADAIAVRFVIFILIIASLVAFYWFNNGSDLWLEYTVATLVVTCPCALSLATPSALTAASGQLAKLGLLPVRSHVLETLAKATDFVFDKTGTLTKGELTLIRVDTLSELDEQQSLDIAAALEAESEHPLARAIIARATMKEKNKPLHASDCINTPGSGISGIIDDKPWHIGNLNYIGQQAELKNSDKALKAVDDDITSIMLASDSEVVAILYFEDRIRNEASEMVSQLHHHGVHTHLLTGDHKTIAAKVAQQLKIENVTAETRPNSKLEYLRQLQQQDKTVVMTGDGINDAPVLAGADVSIAMGSGSELTTTNADMVLISNDVLHIASGFRLAKKTSNIIKQNLSWAIIYNLIAIPAAAMGYVQPWMAAIGMSLSSLIVVLNALRLSR